MGLRRAKPVERMREAWTGSGRTDHQQPQPTLGSYKRLGFKVDHEDIAPDRVVIHMSAVVPNAGSGIRETAKFRGKAALVAVAVKTQAT